VLVHDSLDTMLRLSALRQRGVRIAIDDFGTGYSSLGYLTRLPIDILKIDRCFIAEMGRGSEASAVAQAVIRLSQALRLETVAEGIELESQADSMRRLGCSLGQGYYFARPLAAAAMDTFLAELPTELPASTPTSTHPRPLAS
jgi:EAL domain-containing protein (putative c-di-GMP-specific phosphodiesterase class I)